MMRTYLVAIGIIFVLFGGWIAVQFFARVFSARHPQFGPAREEGGECGVSCGCSSKFTCKEKHQG